MGGGTSPPGPASARHRLSPPPNAHWARVLQPPTPSGLARGGRGAWFPAMQSLYTVPIPDSRWAPLPLGTTDSAKGSPLTCSWRGAHAHGVTSWTTGPWPAQDPQPPFLPAVPGQWGHRGHETVRGEPH